MQGLMRSPYCAHRHIPPPADFLVRSSAHLTHANFQAACSIYRRPLINVACQWAGVIMS